MSDQPRNSSDGPPNDVALWVDEDADRIEAAWRSLTPPQIADFLGDVSGEQRAVLLAELAMVDAAYRRRLVETAEPVEGLRASAETSSPDTSPTPVLVHDPAPATVALTA